MPKVLIAYYSRTGTTKIIASTLAERFHAQLIEIKDLKPRDGIQGFLSAGKDAAEGIKTTIEPASIDLSEYDIIFLGTPVWAGRPTPAILTFVDNSDFHNKKVVLFVTMHFCGGRKTIYELTRKIEEKGGKVIHGLVKKTLLVSKQKLIQWAQQVNIPSI